MVFEQVINVDRMEQAVALFGSFDENVRLIETEYGVDIIMRGGELKISGDAENVSQASRVVESLLSLINRGEALTEQSVRYCISLVKDGSEEKLEALAGDCICITAKGKPIKPKDARSENNILALIQGIIPLRFGIGPAGTGKTYLAVAMAVRCIPCARYQPYHSDETGSGSRRKARLFAGRFAAIRWILIFVRCTMRCLICWVQKRINEIC